MILGPVAENFFRAAMQQSGDSSVCVRQPTSAFILALVLLALVVPPALRMRGRARA